MALLLSSVLCLVQIPGLRAVAIQSRRSHDVSVMQPAVVANTLVQVEKKWRDDSSSFLECNTKHTLSKDRCEGPKNEFLKSCFSVMTAVVKSSSGERGVVKEYMQDVCGQSVLQGWWKDSCISFASALDEGMTDDSYTNRVDLNLSTPCTNLFQSMSAGEAKRLTKEADERAAMEKKQAEERAEAERKAAEAKAEAERKAAEERAVAERKAAVEKAEAERKMAEEAKKRAEEEKIKAQDEAKKRAEEAKKLAENAAHQAEEARNKTAEAAANLKQKGKESQGKADVAKVHKPKPTTVTKTASKVGKSTSGPAKAVAPTAAPVHNATVVQKADVKKESMPVSATKKTLASKSSKK